MGSHPSRCGGLVLLTPGKNTTLGLPSLIVRVQLFDELLDEDALA